MTQDQAPFGGAVNGNGRHHVASGPVSARGRAAAAGHVLPDRPWTEGDRPPHQHEAERYVLACILTEPGILAEITDVLTDEDFFLPAHQVIYLACVFMWAAGEPVNAITVKDRIDQDGNTRALGGPGQAGVLLADLVGLLAVPAQALYHAQLIRRESVARQLIACGRRLCQRGLDADPYEQLAAAEAELAALGRSTRQDGADKPMTAADFLARDFARLPPVIRGLLDREDRAIFTGGEGLGKTTLLLQLGIGAAIGVHPFSPGDAIEPQRVLWIDLENPRAHVHRELQKFRAIAERYDGAWERANFTVWSHTRGVNLGNANDRAKLASVIQRARPDLIIGGPIYKMIRDKGEGAEQLHSTVTNFWDDMRAQFTMALILETHQPGQVGSMKRAQRPIGSSIYQRWPEFGFTLRPLPPRPGTRPHLAGADRAQPDAAPVLAVGAGL
jgi:replicative DNA helicase